MDILFGCIKLRAMELKDTDLLFKMINSPGIEASTVDFNYAVSMKDHKRWVEEFKNSDREIRWMIDVKNEITLGMIILNNIDWKNRSAEIGIKINVNERKRVLGDTLDAEYAAIQYAFDELGLNRLEGMILEENGLSLRMANELGWKQEGIMRSKIFKNGMYHNVIFLSIIKNEFIRYPDGKAPWQKKEEYGQIIGI